MATKYVRALPYTTGNPANELPLITKFMYEFMGYCVNGTSSLTTPGGFPSVTYTGGGLPPNFLDGNPTTTVNFSTTATSGGTLPLGQIFANSNGFPTQGVLNVTSSNGVQTVYFFGNNGSSFTSVSGGTGTLSVGGAITLLTNLITTVSGSTVLPIGTITVASTAGFPSTGTLLVTSSAGTQ